VRLPLGFPRQSDPVLSCFLLNLLKGDRSPSAPPLELPSSCGSVPAGCYQTAPVLLWHVLPKVSAELIFNVKHLFNIFFIESAFVPKE